MTQYLRQRKGGAWFFQRRVPRDLRHRFKGQNVEEYLGTSDRSEAKRKVAQVNADWEETFAAMRKGEAVTDATVRRIEDQTMRQVFDRLRADPAFAPKALTADLDALLPSLEDDATKIMAQHGIDRARQPR